MKKLLLLLCCLICCLQAVSQPRNNLRVAWEQAWDLKPRDFDDVINTSSVSDSISILNISTSLFQVNNFRKRHTFLKINANGVPLDTIVVNDTASDLYYLQCFTKSHNFWTAGNRPGGTGGIFSLINLTKTNLNGDRVLSRKVYLHPTHPLFMDSLPYRALFLIPSSDNGFYLMGERFYRFNNQDVNSINLSRWDSLGNRVWVKDFLLRFQYSTATGIVFDSDGQLLISAISNTEATALKVDTASGNLIWKRVMARSDNNSTCFNFKIYPTPLGYYFHADCPDSSTPNLYSIHSSIPTDSSQVPFFSGRYFGSIRAVYPMADSSMHIMYFNGSRFLIDKLRYDSTLLNRLPITGIQGNPIFGFGDPESFCKVLNSATYFSDGSAILGGYSSVESCGNTAIYYCKIENFGLPYAPIYPPTPVAATPVSSPAKTSFVNWKIYPNPNNGTFRSSLSGDLKIYNSLGQLVYENKVEEGEEVQVGQVVKGIYWAILQRGDIQHQQKIVINP